MPDEDLRITAAIKEFLFSRAPLLYLVISQKGLIVEHNWYVEHILGKDSREQKFQDLLVEFSPEIDLSYLASLPSKEHIVHLTTADGLPRSFYLTVKQIGNDWLVLGHSDIEESESTQKELLLLNRELNNLTRQLHKKNAILEKLNQEKNRFLGMASHDLRSPIGLIVACTELLLDEAETTLSKEHYEFVKMIHGSSQYMTKIVDDFLSSSRIDSGKFPIQLEPTRIEDVVERSLQMCRLVAQRKGIEITVCPEDFPLIIEVDSAKIEQVITNLITNAIEHSSSGSTVAIELSQKPGCIDLAVQDFGEGIPQDELENIFTAFESRTKGTGNRCKRTGLGLYIAQKIVKAHGGKITVASRVGEGTRFCVTLPT